MLEVQKCAKIFPSRAGLCGKLALALPGSSICCSLQDNHGEHSCLASRDLLTRQAACCRSKVVSRTHRPNVPACAVSKGPSLKLVAVLGLVVLAVVVVAAVRLEVSNTYCPVVAQTSISQPC